MKPGSMQSDALAAGLDSAVARRVRPADHAAEIRGGTMANLNGRARQENTYDAIVVGSGISGGWAAKELTQ